MNPFAGGLYGEQVLGLELILLPKLDKFPKLLFEMPFQRQIIRIQKAKKHNRDESQSCQRVLCLYLI